MGRDVYLDNNATTMVAPEVLEAMLPFYKNRYGNASSMHSFGGLVAKDMEHARHQVAMLLGAENDFEITFYRVPQQKATTLQYAGLHHTTVTKNM